MIALSIFLGLLAGALLVVIVLQRRALRELEGELGELLRIGEQSIAIARRIGCQCPACRLLRGSLPKVRARSKG